MTLRLAHCSDDAVWDEFVGDSLQGSIFCYTGFLQALEETFERYFVVEDNQPVVGTVLLTRDGSPLPAPYPFTCYQGVMFSKAVEEMPIHRRVPAKLKLLDYLLGELSNRYRCLSFCLHHEFSDLRSFLWFNYHEPAKGRFAVDLRYTGLLNLCELGTREEYLGQVRELRRREYSRAVREGVSVENSDDVDLLDWLHELTFKRQSITRSSDEVRLLRSISRNALNAKFGKLLVARCSTGEAASAYLCLFDRKCAYYLFGANHPELRKTAASSYLMFHAIDLFKNEGIQYFDFVGINSPNRGDFKISFNAEPKPYCVVNWMKR
jgi:hypothetical protein